MRIGVLSRRAPIGQTSDLTATLEHVGGLTRVLPALAEFADINWTALTTQSQVGLPKHYSLAKVSGQDYRNHIDIFLAEVDEIELNQSDWFCANYVWPLLHDLPMPKIADEELEHYFTAMSSISSSMVAECVDSENDGYFVNDFQLSQVSLALRGIEPAKQISFFLHTPWPKSVPTSGNAIKILEFLASGILTADVIQFQTQKDLQAFNEFVANHLPTDEVSEKLLVNSVSVNVQQLQTQLNSNEDSTNLRDDEISYVHIARTDPVKNTLASINAFTRLALDFKVAAPRKYLDLYIVPSRQQWPIYQKLLAEIVQVAEECNSKLSLLNYAPIRLHIGNDYQRAIQALARYDYLIVCSVADGLNLVVKEGATLNSRSGVIISTRPVGAMAELGEFCVVADGVDEADIANALEEAGNLPNEARQEMSLQLKAFVSKFDANYWAQSVVAHFKILEKV